MAYLCMVNGITNKGEFMKISDIWKKQVLDLTKKLKNQYNKTGSINAADVEKVVVLSETGERTK